MVAASTCRDENEVVSWNDMKAFLARHGIALDKQPGVCSTGIDEFH